MSEISDDLREALGPRNALAPKGMLDARRNLVQREAVVVELAPRSERQRSMLRQHVGLERFAYNWAVRQHMENGWPIGGKAGAEGRRAAAEARERGEELAWAKKLTWQDLDGRWTKVRDEEAPWSRALARDPARYAIRSVDAAYDAAIRRLKDGARGRAVGWPRFRRRDHQHRAFTLDASSGVKYTRWAIYLRKIGMVPVRNARRHDDLCKLDGAKVNRIVVSERAGRWWCAIMIDRAADPAPEPGDLGLPVGMDLGHVITMSDGRIYEPPLPLARLARWIANWERAKSRRVGPLDPEWRKERKRARAAGETPPEPSRRYERAKRHEQAMHLRAAHVRRDWLHQVSTDIARRYGIVVTEGFDVRALVKKDPKRRQSKRMRRTALDIGWGELRTMLAYKMERAGKVLLQLGRHELTDQSCSLCGDVDQRRDGLFRCPSCGHVDTRPRNTADLLARIGRGDPPQGFGSGNGAAPSGEDGVNARGADSASSGGRRRRSEVGHEDPGGTSGLSGPTFSPDARKTGVLCGKTSRASARIAKVRKHSAAKRKRGSRNGSSSS